jgi:hypothetical protein
MQGRRRKVVRVEVAVDGRGVRIDMQDWQR